jgi:hypothetical protein
MSPVQGARRDHDTYLGEEILTHGGGGQISSKFNRIQEISKLKIGFIVRGCQ